MLPGSRRLGAFQGERRSFSPGLRWHVVGENQLLARIEAEKTKGRLLACSVGAARLP